jgi:hypothetical protein
MLTGIGGFAVASKALWLLSVMQLFKKPPAKFRASAKVIEITETGFAE